MAARRQTSTRRAASRAAKGAVHVNWRARVNKPKITDPKQQKEAIRRAGSRIKTTARIDTIHPGQEH
jgi:hypothetical protein